MDFKGKDFIQITDFSGEELRYLIGLALSFKEKKIKKERHAYLKNKNVALVFDDDSNYTKCFFEVAAKDLGMGVTSMERAEFKNSSAVKDLSVIFSKTYDGIGYRGGKHDKLSLFAKHSDIPVWNGYTKHADPIQVLGDFVTIYEHFKKLKGLNLVYFGDGKLSTCDSLMMMCAKVGVNFTCCGPKSLWPSEELKNKAIEISKGKSSVEFTEDINKASEGKDIVYTNVWLTGLEDESVHKNIIDLLSPYCVTSEIMEKTNEKSIFLHSLPAFHNASTEFGKSIKEKYDDALMEVTDEVFNSPKSLVFDEAENKMHAIKAIMYATLKD